MAEVRCLPAGSPDLVGVALTLPYSLPGAGVRTTAPRGEPASISVGCLRSLTWRASRPRGAGVADRHGLGIVAGAARLWLQVLAQPWVVADRWNSSRKPGSARARSIAGPFPYSLGVWGRKTCTRHWPCWLFVTVAAAMRWPGRRRCCFLKLPPSLMLHQGFVQKADKAGSSRGRSAATRSSRFAAASRSPRSWAVQPAVLKVYSHQQGRTDAASVDRGHSGQRTDC